MPGDFQHKLSRNIYKKRRRKVFLHTFFCQCLICPWAERSWLTFFSCGVHRRRACHQFETSWMEQPKSLTNFFFFLPILKSRLLEAFRVQVDLVMLSPFDSCLEKSQTISCRNDGKKFKQKIRLSTFERKNKWRASYWTNPRRNVFRKIRC